MIFTGFDSAWGGKAPGAICDLELEYRGSGDALSISCEPALMRWPEAVAHFSCHYRDVQKHIVAIDQGLVVPNENGMRPVERKIASALMSKYQCGAHASNRGNRSCYGHEAGIWKLIAQLEASGYRHSPESIAKCGSADGKFYFECYPHPAIIGLFELDRTLQYKVHKKNSKDWEMLVERIRSLESAAFPIVNIAEFVRHDFQQSKANEDKLDSIVAAYTAAWLWKYGWEKSMCLGDASTGYFVTPVSEGLRNELRTVFPAHVAIDMAPLASLPQSKRDVTSEEGDLVVQSSPNMAADSEFSTEALLRITDTGCLWGNENHWMKRELCVGHLLEIDVVGVPEEPRICFGPFRNQGESQFGMSLYDADSKINWRHLAEGASKESAFELKIKFRYSPLPIEAAKETRHKA